MVTDKRKEKISAFLDNDMHRDELMSFSLSSESDDAKIAQRYQMVGDALRGEMSDSSFIDVSSAVRDAVAEIPMAEMSIEASTEKSSQQSTPQSSQQPVKPDSVDRPFWNLSAWFKPVAGMAMAVTVAVVMVVTVTEQDGAGIAPVAKNIDSQPAAVQLAVDTAPSDSGAPVNQHLVTQHLEFATQDTLQGRLPYVRAVSFEPGNRLESKVSEEEAPEGAVKNTIVTE
ncbi:MAG: sigma-E factor negative regulatory protein [Proteobacteria bacterium]|nr:sigma-E factor negative regulatory protein [Pseudomonadota bacterium]